MQNSRILSAPRDLRPRPLPAHLSELPFPKLLPEDQLLPWELSGRDVFPGEGVHSEGGYGVHVAASDALQPHNVRLGIVWCIAMETLVWCALCDIRLGITSSTPCRKEMEDVFVPFIPFSFVNHNIGS